jgi:hypothetical protein
MNCPQCFAQAAPMSDTFRVRKAIIFGLVLLGFVHSTLAIDKA